jgi:hypothetical protein
MVSVIGFWNDKSIKFNSLNKMRTYLKKNKPISGTLCFLIYEYNHAPFEVKASNYKQHLNKMIKLDRYGRRES